MLQHECDTVSRRCRPFMLSGWQLLESTLTAAQCFSPAIPLGPQRNVPRVLLEWSSENLMKHEEAFPLNALLLMVYCRVWIFSLQELSGRYQNQSTLA
jgi:hypothetical protein